jgi:uncharacterized protein YbaP (TraB family)
MGELRSRPVADAQSPLMNHSFWLRARCWMGLALALVFARSNAQEFPHHEYFWAITNRASVVYLLGSIHVLRQTDYPLPKIIDDAFVRAEQVVFEVSLDEWNSPGTFSYLQSKATFPSGQTIHQNVSAETDQLLAAYLKETGLKLDDSFRPWYVTGIVNNQESSRLGYLGELGVDQYFFGRAKALAKPVLALETVNFQIDLLADSSAAQQEKDLREWLLNRGTFGKNLDELIASWKTGNIAKLAELLELDRAANPDYSKQIFADRNVRWVPQIEAFLNQSKVTLVVAGAGHFVGPEGVVNLLRRKGYSVWQLPDWPTRLLAAKPLPDGSMQLNFEVVTGHNYALEASPNLLVWNPIHRFVSTDSTRSYIDPPSRDASRRFYRLKNLDASQIP